MKGLETCLSNGARDVPFAVIFLGNQDGTAKRVTVHDPARHVASAKPHIDLGDPNVWPLAQAVHGAPILIDLDRVWAGWLQTDSRQNGSVDQLSDVPRQALIAPITGAEGEEAVGYIVAALNPHRFVRFLLSGLYRAPDRAGGRGRGARGRV